MILLPAIDLYDGKVVRLTKGDYAQMTVYRDDPVAQAADFQAAGAKWLHTVDLEGAKDGTTPNFPVIAAIWKDFDETLKQCVRMTTDSVEALPALHRFCGKALRLIAPLM